MNLSKNYNNDYLLLLDRINLLIDFKKINSSTLKDSFLNKFRFPFKKNPQHNNLFHCLKNISLTIKEGDKIGLVGRNGAGKTSLCHIMVGNYTPTTGLVTHNCKIRSVFTTNPQIYPELTGAENAQLVARLLYPEATDILLTKLVNESISFAELEKFSDVAIKSYSKGMLTRLFLSIITAYPAEILILDEAFDGADEFFKEKFSPRLENIINLSKATIFINHDSEMLKRHVNRVIVMDKGEVIFDGNPTKGFFYYKSLNQRDS